MKNGESSTNNIKNLYVGEGLWAQIQPPPPITIKVEDLYEGLREDFWWIIDCLFVNRPDLHERIKKYKDEKSIQDKTLESSKESPKEC